MARSAATPTPPTEQQPTADAAKKAKAKRRAKRAKLRAKLKLFRFYEKQIDHAVPTASIICALSTKEGVDLYTVKGDTVEVYKNISRTLCSMEALRKHGFMRIHDNTVLNMKHYRGMDKGRRVTLAYDITPDIFVSVRLVPEVARFLKRHCY